MEASTLSSDATKEDEDSKNLAVDVTQGSASHPSERNLGSNDDGDGAACGSTTGFEAKKLSVKEQTEADMANLGKRARKRLEKFQRAKERKVEKKAEAKEARKERLQTDPAYAAAQAKRHTPHDDPAIAEAKKRANEARRVGARAEFVCASRRGPTVVFDMSEEWELAMHVPERSSLAQQLMFAYGYNKRSLHPCRLLVTGLPQGGLVEKGVNKHAGSGNWQAMAFSHAPLAEHLPSLKSSGAGLGASLAMQPAQNDGPTYFLNPMNIAVAAAEARKRAKADGIAASAESSDLDRRTFGTAEAANTGKANTDTNSTATTEPSASVDGEDTTGASSSEPEANETATSTAVLTPSINSYVYDPKLAQAVWDQEGKASRVAVEAAEQDPWPINAEVLYLTADGEEELNEVPWHPGIVYVLGAIVDRNRLQRAAINKAEALKIRTVRLPLDKHITMDKTKVLTVNHCLELLTRVGHGEKWGEALQRTLPSRKNAEFEDGSSGGGDDEGGGDGDGVERGDEGDKPAAPQSGGGKGKKGGEGSSKNGNTQAAGSRVCYQFQRGECTRGAACKFSHGAPSSTSTSGDGGEQPSELPIAGNDAQQTTRKKRKNTESASSDPTYCRDMRFL